MNDFTASNGIELRIAADLSGQKYLSGTVPNEHGPVGFTPTLHATASEEGMAALREFFQAEADERYGVWRSAVDPDVLVYRVDADTVKLHDPSSHGNTATFERSDLDGLGPLSRVARAYFDAHPESKPWHDAKPGEVWALTWDGTEGVFLHAGGSWYGQGDMRVVLDHPIRDENITAGRRIWPEVTW